MVGSGSVISTDRQNSHRFALVLAGVLGLGVMFDPGGATALAQEGIRLTARESTPPDQDLTGYWVSVVTQHWHHRMRMPPRGDSAKIPMSAEGERLFHGWDPAADKAGGEECRAYGAGNIMRIPGRLHIHWADDNTLQIDTDSGTQTRLLQFAPEIPAEQVEPSWQGRSVAAWVGREGAPEGDRYADQNDPDAARYLAASTTRLRPGYLLKNGVPYSASTRLEEYFDTFTEPNGDTWLVVNAIISDPEYLARPHVTSNQFRKLPDGTGWDPTPCSVDHPR